MAVRTAKRRVSRVVSRGEGDGWRTVFQRGRVVFFWISEEDCASCGLDGVRFGEVRFEELVCKEFLSEEFISEEILSTDLMSEEHVSEEFKVKEVMLVQRQVLAAPETKQKEQSGGTSLQP